MKTVRMILELLDERRFIIELVLLAFLLSGACYLIAYHPASAYYYVSQGDTVYVNQSVDLTGVTRPYMYIAYWDGFDMYEYNATFQILLPTSRPQLANFWLDPAIFANRLGTWYKYNGEYEPNSNNLAFVVAKTPSPRANETIDNTTIPLQNPNQTPVVVPTIPLLPTHHISDYLVARGDSLLIPVASPSNAWIFGIREAMYGHLSVNNKLDISASVINRLSPGKYTLLLQSHETTSDVGFVVRYNASTENIEWFDPATFSINRYSTAGQPPDNVLNKLKQILPTTHDTFTTYGMEVQDPTISINQIDPIYALNDTSNDASISLNSQSFLDVRGYTNVAPDTVIRAGIDIDFNAAGDVWKDTIATKAEGDVGGDMREFKVLIPLDLYNLPSCATGRCQHTVSVKTTLADKVISTAPFYLYETPSGNLPQNTTIRYVAGRYGPEEIVPTPTPITVTQVVTQIVTQVITIPVTPSNEQVFAQQKIAEDLKWAEKEKTYATFGGAGIILVGVVFFGGRYGISVYRRAKVK